MAPPPPAESSTLVSTQQQETTQERYPTQTNVDETHPISSSPAGNPILLTVTQASSHDLKQTLNNNPSSNVHTNNSNNLSNNNQTNQSLDEKQRNHQHSRHESNISGQSNNQPHQNVKPNNNNHSNIGGGTAADETTSFTGSPLADLLSQMEIYNWEDFVRNLTHYHHGSRTNSFITNASSVTPRDSTPTNQVNGHLTTDHHTGPTHDIHLPSATTNTTTDIPKMTISKLSRYYSIVLVVRRYVRHGGCGFCNRRIVELVNWFKSLLQIGIIPVVLHAESEEDGNEFFHHFKNPNIAHIPRVSDPKYDISSTLLKMSGSSPLVFKELTLIDGLKIYKDYKSAVKEGYTLERHPKDRVFEENTQNLVPKMLLIKNNQVVHVWDHGFGEGAPDVLSTVILKLPWLVMTTNDMLSGKTGGDLTDLHTRGSISSNVTDIEMRNNYLGIPTNVTRKISNSGTSPSRKISNSSNNGVHHGSASQNHQYLGTSVDSNNSKKNISSSPAKGSPKPQSGNSIQYYLDQLSQKEKNPVTDSTDQEQDAFDIISPTENGPQGDTKLLLSPSKKVQSSEELLIEDIKPEMVEIPDLPLGRNTPRSVDGSSDTTQTFDLSRMKFKLSYFRKVEGVLDFEQVSQDQLKDEEKKKTEQAKNELKKKQKKSFSCFSKEETIDEYTSDIASIKVNLQSILLDEDKRKYFKVFAMKEFNAENIFFWEDVNLIYKKLFLDLHNISTSNEELREKIQNTATYLTGKYFLDDMSLFILNTSNNLKNQVIKLTKTTDYFTTDDCKFLYDDILVEILTTVLPDMYYRFIASDQYQNMLKDLRRSR